VVYFLFIDINDPCISVPCQNGGECELRENGYRCLCNVGWNGLNCNKEVCKCWG